MNTARTFFFIALLPFFLPLSLSHADGYLIRKISVVSNYKTQEFIIRQELEFREGQTCSPDELEKSLSNSFQNLCNLGIFADVSFSVRPDPASPSAPTQGTVPAEITATVIDKWTLFPLPYYFYDNKLGSSIGFFCNEKNFFGLNQELNFNLLYQTGPDKKEISFTYNYPRILGSRFLLNCKFTYLNFLDALYEGPAQTYSANSTSWSFYGKVTFQLFRDVFPISVGISTTAQISTNIVLQNDAGKVPDNLTSWYLSAGVEQGIVNRQGGIVWGDDNYLWLGISPLDGSPMIKLQHAKYFTVFGKSVFAYQINAWITPAQDNPLDSGDIRGIKLGEVRGKYLFYGKAEYRQYLFTLSWPTVLDFYMPIFFDFGNGTERDFSVTNTLYSAGLGLRIYPKYLGGNKSGLRFDVGLNLAHLFAGYSFQNYFYIAFDVEDMF